MYLIKYIISIIYIYASKLCKDIWNAKIECRDNINDLKKSIDNINKMI